MKTFMNITNYRSKSNNPHQPPSQTAQNYTSTQAFGTRINPSTFTFQIEF